MKATKNMLAIVPHLDLLTLLQVVFKDDGDTIPEGEGPEYTREPGDTARGTMRSSLARRIFAAHNELAQVGIALHDAHSIYHETWEQHGGPVCKAHNTQMKRIVARVNVLRRLMWFEATSHHPQLGSNTVTLYNGWVICSQAGSPPWNNLTPEINPGDEVHGFMEHLRFIVGATKNIKASNVPLKPIAAKEKALTTVTDGRLRSLWAFATRIDEALTAYQAGGKTGEKFDLTVAHYRNTAELARKLFWCALQDTDPAVADLDAEQAEQLELRDGWKVVQVGIDPEDLQAIKQQMLGSILGQMFGPGELPPDVGEPTDRTSEQPDDKRMRVRIIRVGGAPDAEGQNGQDAGPDGLFVQLRRHLAGKF